MTILSNVSFTAEFNFKADIALIVVWDLRSFKKPLATHSSLTTLYSTTNAIFSPDDKYVLTGAGATSKGGKGRLMFLEKGTLETVKELHVDTTPVRVLWHSKINQVSIVAHASLRKAETDQDFDRTCQWSNLRALFAAHFSQRCKATAQQRAAAQSYYRRHVRRPGRASHHHATCAPNVQGWGDCPRYQAQAREGSYGSPQEQAARTTSHWTR